MMYDKTNKCDFEFTDRTDFMRMAQAHGSSLSAFQMQKNGQYNEALNEM